MNEFIEKLIGMLENRIEYNKLCHKEFPNAKMSLIYEVQINAYKNAIDIVKQLAKKYNNGWISVDDKKPEKFESVLVSCKGIVDGIHGCDKIEFVGEGVMFSKDHWEIQGHSGVKDVEVIAWQPLPKVYKQN